MEAALAASHTEIEDKKRVAKGLRPSTEFERGPILGETVELSSKSGFFVFTHAGFVQDLDNEASSEEEVYSLPRRVVQKINKKDSTKYAAYARNVKELEYENEVLKAKCRQYRTKIKKIERLCQASKNRNEFLGKRGGSNLESGIIITGEIKSDEEDEDHCNKVKYYCNAQDSDE